MIIEQPVPHFYFHFIIFFEHNRNLQNFTPLLWLWQSAALSREDDVMTVGEKIEYMNYIIWGWEAIIELSATTLLYSIHNLPSKATVSTTSIPYAWERDILFCGRLWIDSSRKRWIYAVYEDEKWQFRSLLPHDYFQFIIFLGSSL